MHTWPMKGEYIQLDQLLKKYDIIASGGQIGAFLEMHEVFLNGIKYVKKERKSE